jgi:hypothetical protein
MSKKTTKAAPRKAKDHDSQGRDATGLPARDEVSAQEEVSPSANTK